jgi:hypothetical protein
MGVAVVTGSAGLIGAETVRRSGAGVRAVFRDEDCVFPRGLPDGARARGKGLDGRV